MDKIAKYNQIQNMQPKKEKLFTFLVFPDYVLKWRAKKETNYFLSFLVAHYGIELHCLWPCMALCGLGHAIH